MSEYVIEVVPKTRFPDPGGIATEKDAGDLGVRIPGSIHVGFLYRIGGSIRVDALETIASTLLSDPVTQQYSVRHGKAADTGTSGNRRVEVWYHSCVTDTVGETVKIGIADLGIKGVTQVSTGTSYIFNKNISEKTLRFLAQKLLANSIIQYCKYF